MPRLTIFRKLLLITLLLSLLPLFLSSLFLFGNLHSIGSRLSAEISETADRQATESLQMRARQVAENLTDFLHQCESDLLFLSHSRLDQTTLLNFYDTRRGEVWERGGIVQTPRETRQLIPLYQSVAFIDRDGREQMVIKDGHFVTRSELRNVSDPARTEYLTENYFQRIRDLKKGEIYVSHLTGFHVLRDEQLKGAPDPESAYNGAGYRGVIRFGAPRFDASGHFSGMVVLSLDHRHLMEFTQHIDPRSSFSTVFPSYKTGNYAFIFDDEGWIITHPKFWDIRGMDQKGSPVPPYTAHSSKEDVEKGRIPFNLDQAGFIHPGYPTVAAQVRKGKTGQVDITNVGGAKKIMAYAPILYDTGDYRKHGIFGGVTIGFQVNQFHEAASKGRSLIESQLGKHATTSAMIILATALLAALSAWALARGMIRPLGRLTEGAARLAAGETHQKIVVTSSDEIGDLANAFNLMADELKERKLNLLSTLDELRDSRREMLDERDFKASIVESISSSIMTFSPEGRLTSINKTGRTYLGKEVELTAHFREIFQGWGDLSCRIEGALTHLTGLGRHQLVLEVNGGRRFFDIGLFPIGAHAEKGLTVTMRNETEREEMHQEMMRLDRLASLGKFSAGIAHEVRNPLTGVSLLLDDLHDRAEAGSEEQRLLKKALIEIERVERLISALLNYAAPGRTERTVCDLNHLVRDLLLLLSRPCQRQKVELHLVEGVIPPLNLDPEKIKQALLNILKNAQEAQPGGGRIEVATRVEAGYAVVTVQDRGPGILPEHLPLIFEPFFTRKGAGTGLGLSITQRIIEEHGGKISVENLPDGGARFTLYLPK